MPPEIPLILQQKNFHAVLRSMGRRQGMGAPVRDVFFKTEIDGKTHYPLARLMSSRSGPGGGRGGQSRLALYLSLLWVASGKDHSSQRPANFWAGLLGLPDPDDAGSRVVRSAWKELEVRQLVTLAGGTYDGDVPTVTLLREDGSGAPYTIPTGRNGDYYRRVPEQAWNRLIGEPSLTGPGLAMYLVAVRTAEQARRNTGLTFPRAYFQSEYGLGDSTRKSGLRNLSEMAVLDARPQRTDDFGEIGRRARLRNLYDLNNLYGPVPRATPSQEPGESSGLREDAPPPVDLSPDVPPQRTAGDAADVF